MKNLFHDLPTGEDISSEVYIVVENPRGSYGKVEYNKDLGVFMLDRASYAPLPYPVEYGFIPQCWNASDDDIADAICLCSQIMYPGIVIKMRVLGLLNMDDSGEEDNKVFGVPVDDPVFNSVKDMSDISEHRIKEIEFFFSNYKKLMKNKYVNLLGWKDKDYALKFVKEGVDSYKEKFKK